MAKSNPQGINKSIGNGRDDRAITRGDIERPGSKIKIAGTKAKGGSRMKTTIRRKKPRRLIGA